MEDVTTQEHLQLLYIRNPWGQSGNAEWNGRFCDDDDSWDDQKQLKERLGYQFKNDGNWWMEWSDWKKNFNKIYVCKVFPSTWAQFSIHGEWKGITNGGPYIFLADRDEEAKDASVQLDTDDKWFNNPQFRLSVNKKTQVIISLMQDDINISGKPYIPVNFLVVRVKSKRDRLWEVDRDDVVFEAKGLQRFKQREITCTLTLSPTHEKKNLHYIIVPNIESSPPRSNDERPFHLRVFASEQIDLVELPQTIETQATSKWSAQTAGGKRVLENGKENQHWCRNPQYFLNITKPTLLKIILKKKGGKRIRAPIGLTLTKANAPTVSPPSTIIGKGKDKGKITLPTTLPGRGMSYAHTLKQTIKKEKGADNVPDFEPPQLGMDLQRKL
jgi:calpain, invertebrate